MKKYILFLFFIFTTILLSAQATWDIEVECGGLDCSGFGQKKLLKTSDGNFLVAHTAHVFQDFFQDYLHLVKYDQNGSLMWEKLYDFGTTEPSGIHAGPHLYDFMEVDDSHILCVGILYNGNLIPETQAFFLKVNSEGDSLAFKLYPEYGLNKKIAPLSNDESLLLRTNGYSRVDEVGDVIDEKIIESIGGGIPDVVSGPTEFVIAKGGDNPFGIDTSKYVKYNLFTGDTLAFVKHADIGDVLIKDFDDNILAYSSGLLKMDTDLNPIWKRPEEEFIAIVSQDQKGEAISLSADGGYILGGQSLTAGRLYLIKTDELGYCEWKRTYSSFFFGVTRLHQLIETNDGGIVFLANNDSGFTKLIKVNGEGIFTGLNEVLIEEERIQIYPNPCHDVLLVSSSKNMDGIIQIHNMYGKHIRSIMSNGFQQEIVVDQLVPGVYFLSWEDKKNKNNAVKFIKQG